MPSKYKCLLVSMFYDKIDVCFKKLNMYYASTIFCPYFLNYISDDIWWNIYDNNITDM